MGKKAKQIVENQDIVTMVLLVVILVAGVLKVESAIISGLVALLLGKYGIEALKKRV